MWCLLLLCLLLAACQAEPTPFPVDMLPGDEAFAPQPETARIRYALALNVVPVLDTLDIDPDSVQIIPLDEPFQIEEVGRAYDILVAYGAWPGATLSPVQTSVSLVLNTAIPPLDDPQVILALQTAFNPAALDMPHTAPPTGAAPVVSLANAGWPDGFDLALAYTHEWGVAELVEQWRAVNIFTRIRPFDPSQPIPPLVLIQHSSTDEIPAYFGEHTRSIHLYDLPISYWAVPGLALRFTGQGWPVPE